MRRPTFRQVRQGTLFAILVVVAIWGLRTHLADHRTFAWDRPVSVAVVTLLDDDEGSDFFKEQTFIRRFLSSTGPARRNLREVIAWLHAEYARHTGEEREILEVVTRGPLKLETPPPDVPDVSDSFFERLSGTRTFIGYFDEITTRDELLLGQYDLTLFIYFYDYADVRRREVFTRFDSLASRRNSFGIVFAPVKRSLLGNTCAVVAHELCHLLGASDTYDENGSVFPDGFAEPDREPRYPQRLAEIMSLGRPTAPGIDAPVRDLRECVVGSKTAAEMNWR